MNRPTTPAFSKRFGFLLFVFTLLFLVPVGDSTRAYAQGNLERALNADYFPEAGCPIALTSVRSVLEIDPFGAPAACKVYLTYTNNSSKPVVAVKFRCRYSDSEGKDRGTFHAPDVFNVAPGASRSNRWKREGGLHPNIYGFQIRVLQVKYGDGTFWESARMSELANPQQGIGGETESPQDAPGHEQQSGAQGGQSFQQDQTQTPFEVQQGQGQKQQQQAQTQPAYQQTPQDQQQGYDKSKELPW